MAHDGAASLAPEEVEAFLRQPVPRRIPARLWRATERIACLRPFGALAFAFLLLSALLTGIFPPWQQFGWGWVPSLLFPVAGLSLFAYWLYRRRHLRRLLSLGQPARGVIENVGSGCLSDTGEGPVLITWVSETDCRLRVRLVDADGAARIALGVVWNHVEPRCRHWKETGTPVALLYLPEAPGEIFLTDLWLADPPGDPPE